MGRRRGKTSVRATIIYGGSRGHGKKLWAYSYEEIAEAAETSNAAVRQAVYKKEFDPARLDSIVNWIIRRRSQES